MELPLALFTRLKFDLVRIFPMERAEKSDKAREIYRAKIRFGEFYELSKISVSIYLVRARLSRKCLASKNMKYFVCLRS